MIDIWHLPLISKHTCMCTHVHAHLLTPTLTSTYAKTTTTHMQNISKQIVNAHNPLDECQNIKLSKKGSLLSDSGCKPWRDGEGEELAQL